VCVGEGERKVLIYVNVHPITHNIIIINHPIPPISFSPHTHTHTAHDTQDHPNIVRLEEVYESHSEIYLVQEVCKGGELFDRLDEQPDYHYNEAQVCVCVCVFVYYCVCACS
jgi:serine/threonine protein kinase